MGDAVWFSIADICVEVVRGGQDFGNVGGGAGCLLSNWIMISVLCRFG